MGTPKKSNAIIRIFLEHLKTPNENGSDFLKITMVQKNGWNQALESKHLPLMSLESKSVRIASCACHGIVRFLETRDTRDDG